MRLHEFFTESKANVCLSSSQSDCYVTTKTHGPDAPEQVQKELIKMAKSLYVEVVPGFEDYTSVKPKKTDGEKSPLTKAPEK